MLSLSLVIIGLDNTILNVALPSLQDDLDPPAVDGRLLPARFRRAPAGAFGGVPTALVASRPTGGGWRRSAAPQPLLRCWSTSAEQLIVVQLRDGCRRRDDHAGDARDLPNASPPRMSAAKRSRSGPAMALIGSRPRAALRRPPAGVVRLAPGFMLTWRIVALALALGVPRLRPQQPRPRAGGLRPARVVLSILALTSLVYGVIEAPEAGWDGRHDALLVRPVSSASVLSSARCAPRCMLDLKLFENPRFSVASIGDQPRLIRALLCLTQGTALLAWEAGAATAGRSPSARLPAPSVQARRPLRHPEFLLWHLFRS